MIYLDKKAFGTLHEIEIECKQGKEEVFGSTGV
jgi:hypothetical protein